MKDTQLLKYGFVVDLNGLAVYDHIVNARMPYADKLLEKLKSDEYPVVAKRCQVASEEGIQSPVFRYKGFTGGFDSFQSAYYLSDALTRKGSLPVYFPDTGEVKNLMPLLEGNDRKDALVVTHILRARYITPEIRKPQRAFMQQQQGQKVCSETINISDEEILKIFGRLPSAESSDSPAGIQNSGDFISDRIAGFAS